MLLTLLQIAAPAKGQDAAPPVGAESPSAQTTEVAIPPALRPWATWVLEQDPEGEDRRACPISGPEGARICAWPGRLRLELDAAGGRFEQSWRLYAEDWVPLPGDAETWPLDARAGAAAVPVVWRDGHPVVRLPAGRHALSGGFRWSQRPESLVLPKEVGLVDLSLDGQVQPMPRLGRDGRLWLREPGQAAGAAEGDALRLEVYRLIEDLMPLRVRTRLEMEVSGRAREVQLGPVTLAGGIPLSLASELPARLEPDGVLRAQVRPGRWQLATTSYHVGDVTELSPGPLTEHWPETEVWAFERHPELRQVEIGGVTPIDPRQTRLPPDWAKLPVYLVAAGDRMRLVQQRRGDADPEPDRLELSRELWLDFDGEGYSVRDRIGGQLTRSSRLEATRRLELGQVRIDGVPQLITRLGDAPASGVEVRQGRLDLVVDGRLESDPGRVPASGWAMPLEASRSRLHLPPGWDLLAISGVDNLPGSWLYRWTLLDLFLVLILTMGVGRIWGWPWGGLALAALALTWQAPSAPQLAWLHVLVAAALLRLLPEKPEQTGLARLRWLVLWYRRLSLVALLVIGLPFLVTEVRSGLYPHLDRAAWGGGGAASWHQAGGEATGMGSLAASGYMADEIAAEAEPSLAKRRVEAPLSRPLAPAPSPLERLDPKAQVQTGQGIPTWQFKSFELVWKGPVDEAEQARLWLLDPTGNLVLSLVGSLLVVLLALRLAGVLRAPGRAAGLPAVLMACGLAALAQPGPAQAQDFPSPELLQELRERLLRPPECLPQCLDLPRLEIRAEPDRLTLELTLDAMVGLAAPVPGGLGGWSPVELSLDGKAIDQLGRAQDGGLLVPIPAGRHLVVLSGALPQASSVDIPLPLAPRLVTSGAEGWRIEGLDEGGRPGQQIQLLRVAESQDAIEQPLVQTALPTLLLVERQLRIGVDWRVETRIRRLSSRDFPALLPVALLPGERVQTPGVQVDAELVKVALAPGQIEAGWVSSLEPVSDLELEATRDRRLTESWQLDLSTLWHVETQGIAPVHQRGDANRWLPSWRPLPGERLQLHFTRPEAVPGPTLTIDRVDYRVEPGRRGSDATLELSARSSQGGRHGIRLPEGAELREIAIDGRRLPLPAKTAEIEVPLVPGAQQVRMRWHSDQALTASFQPRVPDLGTTAVNVSESLTLPPGRWALFVAGPEVGPAVLFWGVLIVMAGLALVLGRSRLTPLRAHDWLLLSIGLTLAQVWVVLLVAGWLFALGLRRRLDETTAPWRFNLTQTGLALLTILALSALVGAVQQGLLGSPDMQIVGNGSSGRFLSWYQDRAGPLLPDVWVLSAPMWVYRALMLAWALWLAFRLLGWLRWGWQGFSQPQLWRERLKSKEPPRSRKGRRGQESEERPWSPD
ncbi:NnrS family protein [Thiorhodococcus minor]|uniref:NnrS family protein n=1 Tax=Thiorhodococcus minor TaxID=57489 RepID=A0A6M0JUQ5_9GAMM|nr:NnrS family protein [Thiorhodococcus minor]NEV60889.1 NnrS family protein [Thiorhodococcus minor]